jgi:hypothetical protein
MGAGQGVWTNIVCRREDYIKHMKEKLGNIMIFDVLEEE